MQTPPYVAVTLNNNRPSGAIHKVKLDKKLNMPRHADVYYNRPANPT